MKKETKTGMIRNVILVGITIVIALFIIKTNENKKPIEKENMDYSIKHKHKEAETSLIGQTCTDVGTYYIYCSCGELIETKEGLKVLEHEFTETKSEANCMEAEKNIKICNLCGLEEIEIVGEKLSHIDENADGVCDWCCNYIK